MVHYDLAFTILNHKPASVLDLGGARGYIAKILQNNGVPTVVMDRSEHCYNTRTINDFCIWDIENPPYPFKDKEFDFVFSNAVLEHVSPDKIDFVIREIGRIGNRSYHHGVPVSNEVSEAVFHEDSTHKIYKPHDWWIKKFADLTTNHTTEIYWETPGKPRVAPPGAGRIYNNPTKVAIGCGVDMIYYGWVNIDVFHETCEFVAKHNYYNYAPVDYAFALPFADNSVGMIFIPSIIGTLSDKLTSGLLSECYRMLQPGGIIRIVTIDAKKIFSGYVNEKDVGLRHIVKGVESSRTKLDDLMILYSGYHSFWDFESLSLYLGKFGFTDIAELTPFTSRSKTMKKETIVKYPDISLVLEGTKGDKV